MYNSKKVIIMVMTIAIFLMIIGYAVFSSNLKINGTANIETTWEVLFTKIEKIDVIGKATELASPIASGTTATFQVGLTKPGDGIEYRITVSNREDFDAVIEDIKASYGVNLLVSSSGYLGGHRVYIGVGVCPVINLKENTEVSGGDGTSTNPYVIN